MTTKTKKVTLATVKSFIRKNLGKGLLIKLDTKFDGMYDSVMPVEDDYTEAVADDSHDNHCGVSGAWFVRQSRDFFSRIDTETHEGFHVSNCCGSFDLVIEKPKAVEVDTSDYETRVRKLEAEGITRSDAQGIVDMEMGTVEGEDFAPHPDEFKKAPKAAPVHEVGEVREHISDYVAVLNMVGPADTIFDVERGRRYFKIVAGRDGGHKHVHAFVDKTTGDVLKPASYRKPAKGVRYNLLDQDSRLSCFRRADSTGSYLYAKR